MILNLQMMGRFGNQMFQYAYARAHCEQNGHELRVPRWVGEKVFNIPTTAEPDYSDRSRVLSGYFQNQESLIYTRKQLKEWFTLRDETRKLLDGVPICENAAHLRRGDYAGYGYVVVSTKSYEDAAQRLGLNDVRYMSEETQKDIGLPSELVWLPNFYTMSMAKVLLRANSTFSWWAGVLGDGKIYSPVITGLKGGQEQDCEFVEGNWPKFTDLPFITDLHLKEE